MCLSPCCYPDFYPSFMAGAVLRRNLKLTGIFVAALVLGAVYALFDPSESVWFPKCPVHVITGFDCPGCGSQRAIHALLHADLAGAFRANAFLFLFIPLLLMMGIAEFNRKRWPRFYRLMMHPAMIYGILLIIGIWTIGRNIIG